MNLLSSLHVSLLAQQSILVNTSKMKNTDSIESFLSNYSNTCSIMSCNTQAPDDIFLFFIQTPKILAKQKKDVEIVEDSHSSIKIESTPRRKDLRTVVTSSHLNAKSGIRESNDNREPDIISNTYAILYNIDRLSKRSQQAIMEILIHKQIEVNGKNFALNPNLVIICTCTTLDIHSRLLDEILLYCEAEEMQFDSSQIIDLKNLRGGLALVNENLKIIQFIRDVVIACRHNEGIGILPTSRVYNHIHIAARCHAVLNKRSFVKPSDVIKTVCNVLAQKIHNKVEFVTGIVEQLTYPE
jgi:hypothetical protein